MSKPSIATLQLTNSSIPCLVDSEDLERLSIYKWSLRGTSIHRTEWEGGKLKRYRGISLACEIMKDYTLMFDHIDRNIFNNIKSNLRIASYSQNTANRPKQQGRYSSKYKGVCWYKSQNLWAARIMVNEKQQFLGYFTLETDAAQAYNKAAIKYFGDFACLNQFTT